MGSAETGCYPGQRRFIAWAQNCKNATEKPVMLTFLKSGDETDVMQEGHFGPERESHLPWYTLGSLCLYVNDGTLHALFLVNSFEFFPYMREQWWLMQNSEI